MTRKIKFFIDQHGCAKNRVDGEVLATYLTNARHELTFEPDEADIIIINSCGFIESAKKESINSVLQTRNIYPEKKIILAGCLSERYAETFKDGFPEVDGIFGNGDLSKIVCAVDEVLKNNRSVLKFPQEKISVCERKKFFGFKGSAYVKITEGCSNHCSFCAIPNIRGELRSRKPSEIIFEIENLINSGVYEINLIGQDLAAYGTGFCDDEARNEFINLYSLDVTNKSNDFFPKNKMTPLAALLKLISNLKHKFIIRLLYIHPDHLNFDIFDVIKNDDRFLHYFDIPFQSGSDKIINLMNRKGSFESYKKMIFKMRKIFPDMVLRTTFMTGFSGETENDFELSLEFMKAIKPAWSGCFSYSREEDTPAYKFIEKVPARVAKAWAKLLGSEQEKITSEFLKSFVGKTLDVIVEEIIPKAEDEETCFAIGRAWFQAPEVDGAVVVRYEADEMALQEGDVVKAKILAVSGIDLDGRVV